MPEYCGAEKAFSYSSPVSPSPYGMVANAWLPLWSLLVPSPRESDSSEKVLGSEEGRAVGALEHGVFPAGTPSLELVPHLAGHTLSLLSECPEMWRCVGNLVSPRVRCSPGFVLEMF